MKRYCEHCAEKIDVLDLYCAYCGNPASSKTVPDVPGEDYENGHYCPSCAKKGPEDGRYCGKCGKSMFEKPDNKMFCPFCGEQNRASSNICFSCMFSFENWYRLRGQAAEKVGYKGELSIKEKMTGIKYHFVERDFFRLGRNKDNDIVIPCDFVSGNHLLLDMKNYILRDFQSTNKTCINRSPEPVSECELGLVRELAVAGCFVFKITKMENAFVLRLTAIVDEKECIENGDEDAFEKLRKEYFILMEKKTQSFFIRKEDGKIKTKPDRNREFYKIEYDHGYYYYSDKNRNFNNQILFKTLDTWPKNWEFYK